MKIESIVLLSFIYVVRERWRKRETRWVAIVCKDSLVCVPLKSNYGEFVFRIAERKKNK